jgi:hypothetical protein
VVLKLLTIKVSGCHLVLVILRVISRDRQAGAGGHSCAAASRNQHHLQAVRRKIGFCAVPVTRITMIR